ncbi:hypothetical protein A0E43_19190 [Pectobacterium cacticida]
MGIVFLKKRNNVKASLLINTKYMNACKIKRRIKRRNLDKRLKYSLILTRRAIDSVRRTKGVLIYPAVRRETPKNKKIVVIADSFPCCTIHRLIENFQDKMQQVKIKILTRKIK